MARVVCERIPLEVVSVGGVRDGGAVPGGSDQRGQYTSAGVCSPMPECLRVRWLYQPKNRCQCTQTASIDSNRFGKSGRYLRVLNWAQTAGCRCWCARCDLVTPRSASSSATGLELIDERGRRAGQLVGADVLGGRVLRDQPLGRTFDSRRATIRPTT